MIVLETVGTVLEDMCLCDKSARKLLARVVHDHVTAALNWLHSLKTPLAFVDLHPGNIIIRDGCAYLIDCESCSPIGEPTNKPIRAAFRTLGVDKTPTRETDMRGLLLVLAWIVDMDSFRSGVARIESREVGADKTVALLQKLQTIEDFPVEFCF